MAIIPTHLYNITFSKEDCLDVFVEMKELKNVISPIDAKNIPNNQSYINNDNPYNGVIDRLYTIMDQLNIEYSKCNDHQYYNIDDINKKLDEIDEKLYALNCTIEDINKDYKENKEALELLEHLKNENLSLDDISNLHYLTLRFGKLPIHQINKLGYYEDYHFIYHVLSTNDNIAWIAYCSDNMEAVQIDNMFSSLDFKEVELPDFVHGTMSSAIEELESEDTTMENYIETLHSRIQQLKDDNEHQLNMYMTSMKYYKDLIRQNRYLIDLENKYSLYFYSMKEKEELEKTLNNVTIYELPNDSLNQVNQPIYLSNPAFFKPFEKWGVIRNKDLTLFIGSVVMISSLLLVGDLGVGIALLLIGYLFKKDIFKRLSLAFMVGGLLSGTVFYQMQLYDAILAIQPKQLCFILYLIIIILLMLLQLLKNHKEGERYGNIKT